MDKGSTNAMYKYLEMIYCNLTIMFNPFHATGLFRYTSPPENISKPKVFCFQKVSKETSGMKWVNKLNIKNNARLDQQLFNFWKPYWDSVTTAYNTILWKLKARVWGSIIL